MALLITTTARLRVRPYILQDMEHRHRLTTELYGEPAAAHTRQWLEWTVAAYRELGRLYQPPYGDYVVELQETGAVIGSVGLVPSLVPWGVFNPQTPAPQRYLTSPEFGCTGQCSLLIRATVMPPKQHR
ncbi:MAG: GNAT family N-acetyltransferase [Chloroflexaceae bacterium]|nr:GNAT family N-acetyltransferase [Chloroflexaceae bacterium]